MDAVLKTITDGLPVGTTHVHVSKPYWDQGSYTVRVDAFKYVDGKLKVFKYDSDGEYGQWRSAAQAYFKLPTVVELPKSTSC